jgi:pimeloyl-ACP methyl ester carboxylesterase
MFNNIPLRYAEEGKGIPVVLLHGYLESLEIWDPFAGELATHFRVIRPDLPGHGGSGIHAKVHTMEFLAESVAFLLMSLSVDKCVLIGHSMGGYVTMAFLEAYGSMLSGFSLFHSTPFADTDEKRTNRDREIALVRQGKKDMLINTNIPKGFADNNLKLFCKQVTRAKEIAWKTSNEGIISMLEGMKQRPDRTRLVENATVPFLWILGRKDNYINIDMVSERIKLNRLGQKLMLERSGHMGFIEEPDKSYLEVRTFVEYCAGAA